MTALESIETKKNNKNWKYINGTQKRYMISDTGYVYSCKSKRILNTLKMSAGYLQVKIKQHGKFRQLLIHRLVAQHFLCQPDKNLEVNHLNCNKHDNSVTNLEWCTRGENMKHYYYMKMFAGYLFNQ